MDLNACGAGYACSITQPERVFGKFFANVDACRSLMKEKQVIASGSAILHALLKYPSWNPTEIEFFGSKNEVGISDNSQWHSFLINEGYSTVNVYYEGSRSVRTADVSVRIYLTTLGT